VLAITERSVLLVPPSGSEGVRIPYEMVLSIEVQKSPVTSLIVGSCYGRFDILTLWQKGARTMDPVATAAAAATIKARLASFQSGIDKETEPLQK
jgi:hypothetical protein